MNTKPEQIHSGLNTGSSSSEPDPASVPNTGESGFSLVEVAVALVVLMIAMLGVAATFAYAINYNAGNYSRAQGLAVLQREVEQLRSARFTPMVTDLVLQGGTKPQRTVTLPNGTIYNINTVVDNDPVAGGIQNETVPTSYKEITVTITLALPSPGWQTAVPIKAVLRRVKSN